MIGKQSLNTVIAFNLDVNKMLQLFFKSSIEFFKVYKILCLSGLQANLLFRSGVEPIVKRKFKHLVQVEVAGKCIRLGSESTGFNASAGPAVPGIHQ